MSGSTDTIELGWRLRIRMAENGIASSVELQERLAAIGYDISSAQLSRIVDKRPEQVKTALLGALLSVLGGTLNDLMPMERRSASSAGACKATPVIAPRVEAVINAVMERHPGMGPAAQLRYYEAVHQELGPLARELERENKTMLNALENIRLYAARQRTHDWSQNILRFCAEAGVSGSVLRSDMRIADHPDIHE